MTDRPADLAGWLVAEPLPDATALLPSGRSVQIARYVRRDVRAAAPIERLAPCWAPNKPPIVFEGGVTWAEFIIVRLLERNGWSGRWLLNWAGPRTPCGDVGRAERLPPEVERVVSRIDLRAGIESGGGAWDVVAWRDGETLFIESKQHRSSDRLSGTQLRWLGAALDEGFTPADFAIVEYDLGATAPDPSRPTRPARAPRSTPASSSVPRAPRLTPTRRSQPAEIPAGVARLLERAQAAGPNDRIGFRDQIARAGQPAIRAMEQWIALGIHPGFAVRVIEAAGRLDWSIEARAALRRAQSAADPAIRVDIAEAIRRLTPRRQPRA